MTGNPEAMTPPTKNKEATPEDVKRWERYGAIVDGILAPFYTNWFADPAHEPTCAAFDALADILTEHCRLRAYADPFLTSDPDD